MSDDTIEAAVMKQLSAQFEQEWEIHWEMPYSEWMEYGTGPHGISQEGEDAIFEWVGRKLGLNGEEQRKAANAIIWNIRKNGMDAHPFIRPAIDAIKPKVANIMNKNEDGGRAVCDAIVAKAGDILSASGHEDTGALASNVNVRRLS